MLAERDRVNDNIIHRAVTPICGHASDFHHNLLAGRVGDLTKDGVVVVEVRGGGDSDEELGAVRVPASVGHRQQERAVEGELRVELVLELVAGATHAGAGGIATLDHESSDDAVEDDTVIEVILGQLFKVGHRLRGMVSEQVNGDISMISVESRCCSLASHGYHDKP